MEQKEFEEITKYIEEKDFRKVAKWLQKKIEDLYFGCECSCTYGETYLHKGETYKFVMFRNIMITEGLGISIIVGNREDPTSDKIWKEINKLLKLCILSVDFDDFDNLREFHKIIGVKSQ